MVLTHNLTPPTFYSSFARQSPNSPITPPCHTSHWGDHYPHTLPSPHQTIVLHRLPTAPSSTSLSRGRSLSPHSIFIDHSCAPPALIRLVHSDSLADTLADTVIWASSPGSPGPLRRRSGSDTLHDDFNNSKGFYWLTRHLRLAELYALQIAIDFQASPTLVTPASVALHMINEHGGWTPTPKIHPTQYCKYHLTSSGRPSRFFPRLLDEYKHEAPPVILVSGGPNHNAKRDAINVLTAIREKSLPRVEFGSKF